MVSGVQVSACHVVAEATVFIGWNVVLPVTAQSAAARVAGTALALLGSTWRLFCSAENLAVVLKRSCSEAAGKTKRGWCYPLSTQAISALL